MSLLLRGVVNQAASSSASSSRFGSVARHLRMREWRSSAA
jgi:hypothetical protein